ncbi:MAG: MFS transporter [Actinomycetes bacterium]
MTWAPLQRAAGIFRRSRLDLSPLRQSRDFRLLFFGGSVSFVGSMITYVALPFQVAALTGSYVAVGILGVVELAPLIVFGLYGGALADAVDRRRLVLLTELGFTLVTGALLVNALLPDSHLWLIYAASFVYAVLDGLQRPSLDALIPRIVVPDHLAAASALNSLRMNIGTIAGPALGGLIIAVGGVETAYAVDVISYGASLAALLLMRAAPPPIGAAAPSLRGILEGMQYAWQRKDLLGTYVIDIVAMLFAFPYALFPFIALMYDSPWVLGLLYSAPYVGSLIATLTSGWTSHVHHHGRAIVFGAAVWGGAIIGFGLSPNIWVALFFLAIAGAGDMVSGLFRALMWNLTIPDELRGRLAGIELLSYSTGPQLGQVRSTLMAQATSLRVSLWGGGVLAVIGVFLAPVVLPPVWRFDDRTDVNAVTQRRRREAVMRDDSGTNDVG